MSADLVVPPLAWFVAAVATMLLGQLVHRLFDRSPGAGTLRRRRELGLLWIIVGGGFWTLLRGVVYLARMETQVQWEVGWSDIALGVLLMACVLRRNRGGWLNAAVVALVFLLGSDAVANIWQVVVRQNFTSVHIWSAALDLTQTTLAITFLHIYRRLPADKTEPDRADPDRTPAGEAPPLPG
jgi:hypothetical protein